MTDELVGVERVGDVCVLTLRRPEKLNALSTAVERALGKALGSEELRSSRAVVIAGEGRAFSAGADVTEFREATAESILAYYRDTGDVYERFAALPQPTVAAIHGWCVGGGLELALAADFRVADESAAFRLPEVAIGIIPSSGGTHRLVRLLGAARAKELVLLRDRVDALEALRLGLVTEVVPAGSALDRALELAAGLAQLPPLALSLAKQAIDAMGESSREAGLLIERVAYAALAQTPAATGRGGGVRGGSGLGRAAAAARPDPRRRAAVHDDGRAGDVGAPGRAQEGDHRRDLRGRAEPLQRDCPRPGLEVGVVLIEPFGRDRARRDADRPDPVPAPFERKPGGEVLERRPGSRRVREPRNAAARAEADEDDDAAPPRDQGALGDEARHGPRGIDGEPVHRPPAVRRDLLRRSA